MFLFMDRYKERLKEKMDAFVSEVFLISKLFPKEEIYITVAQLKRAALSIILNYIEGYARFKKGNQLNFLEISYGSLKEVKYLLYFSMKQKFLPEQNYRDLMVRLDEIAAMLWTEVSSLTAALKE